MPRFVAPTGEHVKLDREGFLLLPIEDSWWLPSQSNLRPLTDLVTDEASYVLLAAGGAGKTTAFRWLAGAEADARYINMGSRSRNQQEREIAAAVQADGPIYLDGLDQAANADQQLFPWLEEVLTTPEASRIRWRLACRSAAWRSTLSLRLQSALPMFSDLTLLPMDRDTTAEAFGVEFVDAIAKAGMGRLSASPRQLSSTEAYWSKTGKLPVGQREAIGYEVSKFLLETDEHRRPRLPAERALRIAKRLAAFTTFSGSNLLSTGPTAIDGAIAVHSLPAEPEPVERGLAIEPADYREVLDTTLFEAGQPGTVLFRHQQYEEYLAASYLVDRKISPAQIPALLGVHASGRLPTSRSGVATWLATLKPDLVEDLIEENALLLASSSSELTSDLVKAAVVQALLDDAGNDEQQPEWGADLRALSHPELAEQLESRLSRGLRTSEEVWWIARLAEACGCRRLAPALVELAVDPSWSPYARRMAIVALREVGDDDALLALRGLLDSERDGDPNNEVLAAAVETLYPRFMSTNDLINGLRPMKSSVVGNYRLVLRDLADKIPSEDLPSVARWLSERVGEDRALEDLVVGVVQGLWEHADGPEPREALAELLVSVESSLRWHSGRFQRTELPWLEQDDLADRRRALALAVMELSEADSSMIFDHYLLNASDAHWLLDTLAAPGRSSASTLTTCLTQLLHDPSRSLADRILDLPATHPAYLATSWWRGSIAVDSSDVTKVRELAAGKYRRAQQLLEAEDKIRAGLTSLIARTSSDSDAWLEVALLLGTEPSGAYDKTAEHDYTTRPNWRMLTDNQRDQFFDAGISFLKAHDPVCETWYTSKTILGQDYLPAWSGVHLLTTIAAHVPERIAELEPSVWARWSEAVIATWSPGTSEDLRPTLFKKLPTNILSVLHSAALRYLDALNPSGDFLSQMVVYRLFTPDLGPTISQGLISGRYSGDLARSLLNLVVEHGDGEEATSLCRQLAKSTDPALAALASEYLASFAPTEALDELAATPLLSVNDFATRASRMDVTALDTTRLVTLGALVLDAYPYNTDPPLQSGFVRREEHDIRQVREQVLRRLADLGKPDELEQLRHGRADVDQQLISHHQRFARRRQADLAVGPVQPTELISLLRSADARLVRHDDDLLDAITHALDLLQRRISKANAYRDVWNGITTPKSEDSISDWIQDRFRDLFNQIAVDREIQVRRRKETGVGERSDLTIKAPTLGGGLAQVTIEAKLVSNNELTTALHDQLVGRYLVPFGLTHGIYLVYWVRPGQRPDGWPKSRSADLADLQRELENKASNVPAGMRVLPYILDISRPD